MSSKIIHVANWSIPEDCWAQTGKFPTLEGKRLPVSQVLAMSSKKSTVPYADLKPSIFFSVAPAYRWSPIFFLRAASVIFQSASCWEPNMTAARWLCEL